jgi:hypothetical protein
MSKDNIEFNDPQVVDILLQNWFHVDPMFIVPNFEEEDEGAPKTALKTQAT